MSLCYDLHEMHEMIRSSVREFAEKEIKPVAGELEDKEEFSVQLTHEMGKIGLFGMVVPEKYGGQGLDHISYIIAVEEIARVDGSQAATIAACNSLAIDPIYHFGSEDQREKYLPDLCKGKTLMGFGLTEPDAGSDAGATRTTAVRDGDAWVINGRKTLISNSNTPISKGTIVQTVTGVLPSGKPEYTCFIVENGTPGFALNTMKKKLMWRAANTAELHLEDCRVSHNTIFNDNI
ncbi:acyl-CoA dehydrogenase family protein [Thermodesulfobacteriota bacterium]